MRAADANLAIVGRAKGLDKFVLVNPSQRGLVSVGVMASTIEAIIGAVWLDTDGDLSIVQSVIMELGLLETS